MQLIELAMQHHQAGKLEQAAQLYNQILAKNPKDIDALHLRALLAYQLQHFSHAEQDIREAITLQPKIGLFHKRLADIYQAQGDNDNAYKLYEKALQLDNTLHEAHNNIGLILHQRNKLAEAIKHYRTAIKLKPDFAIAYNNLANIYEQQGKWSTSINYYQQAITIQPRFAQALFNLGNVYYKQQQDEKAIACYLRAVQANNHYFDAHYQLSKTFNRNGQLSQALQHLQYCIELNPQQKQLFVDFTTLAKTASLNAYSKNVENLLISCYQQTGINYQNIALFSAQTLLMKYTDKANKDALFDEILLHLLLRHSFNVEPTLEQLLCKKREDLLRKLEKGETIDNSHYALIISLAIQGFNNEYAFYINDDEHNLLTTLEQQLTINATAIELAIYSMYKPLYHLSFAKQLQQQQMSTPLAEIVEHTLIDYFQEQQIKTSITRLTTIDDQISGLVQQQYEANPYPRWLSLGESTANTLPKLLQNYMNNALLATFDEPSQVLIAGCGSGQQPLRLAASCPDTHIDAFDLSKTSLAYAIRMAKQLTISNVHFFQGDILQLQQSNKQYDYIECCGVLHHLQSPELGLTNLLHVLKPHGILRLALYSETGRQYINTLREQINQKQLPPTEDNIRDIRNYVIENATNNYCDDVLRYSDFYSMSGCRDLLFHCQEHQYTLAKLKAMLEQYQLKLIGFMLRDNRLKAQYLAQFPQDKQIADWQNLEAFEQAMPDSFSCMYQFFVVRE